MADDDTRPPETPESTSPSVDMTTDLHVSSSPEVHPALIAHQPAPVVPGETRLNPKYAFESFVIGSSNRFPHAAAVAVAEALLGHALDYARVDHLRLADGRLALSELEITEPGLYLDELPGNGAAFAAMVAARLAAESGS